MAAEVELVSEESDQTTAKSMINGTKITIKWLTFITCLSSGTSNENFEQANAQKRERNESQREG